MGSTASLVILALLVWAFGFGDLTRDQRSILRAVVPLLSAFVAGSFTGSLTFESKKLWPAAVGTATGGFAVWLISVNLLFPPRPEPKSELTTLKVTAYIGKRPLKKGRVQVLEVAVPEGQREATFQSNGMAIIGPVPTQETYTVEVTFLGCGRPMVLPALEYKPPAPLQLKPVRCDAFSADAQATRRDSGRIPQSDIGQEEGGPEGLEGNDSGPGDGEGGSIGIHGGTDHVAVVTNEPGSATGGVSVKGGKGHVLTVTNKGSTPVGATIGQFLNGKRGKELEKALLVVSAKDRLRYLGEMDEATQKEAICGDHRVNDVVFRETTTVEGNSNLVDKLVRMRTSCPEIVVRKRREKCNPAKIRPSKSTLSRLADDEAQKRRARELCSGALYVPRNAKKKGGWRTFQHSSKEVLGGVELWCGCERAGP